MITPRQVPGKTLYQPLSSACLHGGSEVAESCKAPRIEMNLDTSRQSNTALVRLYDVFENEARRIAHRLHDESSQVLAVVYLELAAIARNSSEETARRLDGVVTHLDEVSSQLRNLSHELRPLILDQLGLLPALCALTQGVRKRSGLSIDLAGSTRGRLSPEVETVIYRTVQEALANTCRHAFATHADVLVWLEDSHVCCAISDNGRGFMIDDGKSTLAKGLGLLGISERTLSLGGTSLVSSQPGQGTTVQVRIPL